MAPHRAFTQRKSGKLRALMNAPAIIGAFEHFQEVHHNAAIIKIHPIGAAGDEAAVDYIEIPEGTTPDLTLPFPLAADAPRQVQDLIRFFDTHPRAAITNLYPLPGGNGGLVVEFVDFTNFVVPVTFS